MKRILFFVPTLSNGGAERVLRNLVNVLCEVKELKYLYLLCLKMSEVNCRKK